MISTLLLQRLILILRNQVPLRKTTHILHSLARRHAPSLVWLSNGSVCRPIHSPVYYLTLLSKDLPFRVHRSCILVLDLPIGRLRSSILTAKCFLFRIVIMILLLRIIVNKTSSFILTIATIVLNLSISLRLLGLTWPDSGSLRFAYPRKGFR